jgi:hypothetical protein
MHFCWQDLEALKCVHESEKEHGFVEEWHKLAAEWFYQCRNCHWISPVSEVC